MPNIVPPAQISYSFMIWFLLFTVAECCRINTLLQGNFHKQPFDKGDTVINRNHRETVIYDQVVIASTSVSSWGNCYENNGNSYIFGMKHVGDSTCYRCVTMIIRAPNIIQAAHPLTNPCKQTIEEARSSCFDEQQVSPSEGTFLYRTTFIDAPSCGLDGQYSVSFTRPFSNISCSSFESSMNNCQFTSQMDFQFRNCSFPEIEMHLNCIGTWKGKNGERYLAVEDEDSGQIRCAMLIRLSPEKLVLHMSDDARCDKLSPNGTAGVDTYRFRQKKSERNLALCRFPEWVQGSYNDVTVSGEKLIYTSRASESASAISYCMDTDESRVAVFSETLCEEAVGFHCFWFCSRSDSVVEFKTTDRYNSYRPDLCRNEKAFEHSSWTVMVAANPDYVSCGYAGIFETPTKHQNPESECYRMTVDCKYNHIMHVTAYECLTGTVHDTRSYTCLAVWRESENMYVYTLRTPQQQNNCFVTRILNGMLYLSSSGIHCQRNYNFTLNNEKTIVLEQKASCVEKTEPSGGIKKSNSNQTIENAQFQHGITSFNVSNRRFYSNTKNTLQYKNVLHSNSGTVSLNFISHITALIIVRLL